MPNEEKVTKTLNQFLDQLGNPLPEKLEESISARVLQRLQSNANLANRDVAAAPAERRPGSFGLFTLIAAAAVVLVLIPMFVIRPLVFPSGSIAVVEGDGGKRVNAGEVIRSNDAAGTVVNLEDGSRIEMRSKSELAVERGADGLRIELHTGGITVKAAKQRAGHLVVQTKDVLISVIGTVFFVEAEESGSRVEVIEGKVQVQQGTTLKKLSVGEEFSTITTPPAPIPVQIPTPIQKVPEEAKSFEATSIRPSDPNQGGGRGVPEGGGRGAPPNRCATRPLQVDPVRFAVVNTTLYRLILLAYGKNCGTASANDLLRAPDWVATERFDIQASIPASVPSYTRDQLDNGNAPELQEMLQTMLADRFKLALHRETREMSVYALTIAKSGLKLKEGAPRPSGVFQGVNPDGHLLHFIDQGEIQRLVNDLSSNPTIHRIVVDKTGLRGEYVFLLGWDSDDDFLDAMQEQWGLKLESAKASVEVLVIDRVEKPSGN